MGTRWVLKMLESRIETSATNAVDAFGIAKFTFRIPSILGIRYPLGDTTYPGTLGAKELSVTM
jgi:hypothetical protein